MMHHDVGGCLRTFQEGSLRVPGLGLLEVRQAGRTSSPFASVKSRRLETVAISISAATSTAMATVHLASREHGPMRCSYLNTKNLAWNRFCVSTCSIAKSQARRVCSPRILLSRSLLWLQTSSIRNPTTSATGVLISGLLLRLVSCMLKIQQLHL